MRKKPVKRRRRSNQNPDHWRAVGGPTSRGPATRSRRGSRASWKAVTAQVTDLQPANEPVVLPVLDALRDNLGAYLVLLDDDELDLIELPRPRSVTR